MEEEILRRIVDYANLSPSDDVLEIGSGIGNLTMFLLDKAGRVTSVEIDERLTRILRKRFGKRNNLEIVQGDILEIELPEFNKVVANLPYSISSPVTFKLLEEKFELGILMYQKEFADRMIAEPGSPNYSRLSVNISYRCNVEILEEIPPRAFIPRPEVRSAVVKVEPREPPFQVKDEEIFLRTVRASFRHRRKKIRNSIFYSFDEIFPNTDFSDSKKRNLIDEALPKELADARAETLSPKEFGKIAELLENYKKEESPS